MTMMANADAAQLMRIRAEEALERKGSGAPRQAGELAGHFAAMLEQLNGVGGQADGGLGGGFGEGGAAGMTVASPVASGASLAHRLGVGAVSVFAQGDEPAEGADGAYTPDPQPPQPEEALQVVQSALNADSASNFRWLTTLLTQAVPETPKPDWT